MFKRDRNLEFDFADYKSLKGFFKEIYYRKILIDRTDVIQQEFSILLDALERYKPRYSEYINKISKLLDNAKRFYDGRKITVDAFKIKYFNLILEKKNKMKIKLQVKVKIYMKMVLLILICLMIQSIEKKI